MEKEIISSPINCFFTTFDTPRWIALEGRTKNIRDLGGYKCENGKRVKQNMIFRGEELNDFSYDGHATGRNRLFVEDVEYLLKDLKIHTDLDLRNSKENANSDKSPLGSSVVYLNCSYLSYWHAFNTAFGKGRTKILFKYFCKRENYPIYMHCVSGADRTGTLAFILNGVLGVSMKDLVFDWESTFFPNIQIMTDRDEAIKRYSSRVELLIEGINCYGNESDSLQKKFEKYLLSCEVSAEEIETFKSIMLE